MAAYKDISDLKKQIADFKRAVHSTNSDYLTGYICALSVVEGMIAGLPDADVVPVVRCKDCKGMNEDKFCIAWEGFVREDDFCSYGERKDK